MCSASEHQSVDLVIDGGPKIAGHMDLKVVEGESFWIGFPVVLLTQVTHEVIYWESILNIKCKMFQVFIQKD